MESLLTEAHSWTILVILAAAWLDTFVFSGYIFYGFALLASASVLYATGSLTLIELLLGAYIGTTLSSTLNFYLGRFGKSLPYIQSVLERETAQRIHQQLHKRSLFLIMLVSRFITLLRPSYGLVLGAFSIPPRTFIIYELIVAALWVGLWSTVMVLGEDITVTILDWLN